MEPSNQVLSTVTVQEATRGKWDIVVIGAGLAGALAARESAVRGCRVLLVDRAVFPRRKVCGCCLNGAALDVLARSGLGDLTKDCGAIPLNRVSISSGNRSVTLKLDTGVSLSRDRLDSALIRAAIEQGVAFIGGVIASAEPVDQMCIRVRLKGKQTQGHCDAKLVIAAGGLGCRIFADGDREQRQVAKTSRIGAGAVLNKCPTEFQPGVVYMNCHSSGYVGLVRLEDDRLDIAAALDIEAVKQRKGPCALVSEILGQSDFPTPHGLQDAAWQGTPMLTQRRVNVAENGCLFAGDAAGYVEPFTGEGMAWALASGSAVAELAVDAINSGNVAKAAEDWKQYHQDLIVRRSTLCKVISRGLRYPAVSQMSVPMLASFPWIARPFIRAMNAPFQFQAFRDPAER